MRKRLRRGAAAVATRESARVGDLCDCVVGSQRISSARSVKLKCYAAKRKRNLRVAHLMH